MRRILTFKLFESSDYNKDIIEDFFEIDGDIMDIWEHLREIEDELEFFKVDYVMLSAISFTGNKTDLAIIENNKFEPKSSTGSYSNEHDVKLLTEHDGSDPEISIMFKINTDRKSLLANWIQSPNRNKKDLLDFNLKCNKLKLESINAINKAFKRYGYIVNFSSNLDSQYEVTLHMIDSELIKKSQRKNKMDYIKEESNQNTNLIVIDVQKSFKKFFTDMYVNQLTKYCKNFQNVYYVFDNHVDGKNVDKDYLYDKKPDDQEDHRDLYDFPNIKDTIEKRYNYDVDVDFYKKILDEKTHKIVDEKESKGLLKKGDLFKTNEGTIIVYINNNHKWFHCPKKLYDLLLKLKGQSVEIVGGSDGECLEDVFITAEALGVKASRNYKYIWSASHCPIR